MRHWAALVALALAALPAAGQILPVPPGSFDPGATQQRQMDEERRRQERERERDMRKPAAEPLIRPEAPAAPAPDAGAAAVRFMVREIRFTTSEILKPEELEAIAREFRGRELSIADLQAVAAKVNALYKAKGVVTAQAVIPPQDVSAGVVQVRLVEGRVGKIDVKGNATTRESYVTGRVSLKPAELVDLERLEQAIIRYNRTNDTQIKAELKPGTEFATTDLYVTLTEPPRHDLRLTIDNSGSPSTGLWREAISYANRSLLGFRDELSVYYSHSSGHDGYSLAYAVPFNPWGGRLSYAYYDDWTAVRHGPLKSLNITGTSTAQILTARQPLWVKEQAQFDLLAGAKKRTSGNSIDSVFLQRTDTADSNLGGDLQLIGGNVGYLSANYSRAWGHAEVVERSEYRIDRGTLRYSRDFASGYTLRANANGQVSPQRLLPSSEQFFIGGEGTVRGYYVGQFGGDHGYVINLELHRALGVLKDEGGAVSAQASGFVFADYGKTYPFRPPNSSLRSYEQLGSVGAGLNYALGSHLYGRLTFAYGLIDLPDRPRAYSLLFQLVANAF